MTAAQIELVGYIAAACTTLCWLPQAVRTIRTKDTRAISLVTQCFFAIGITLWLVYGIALQSWPVIISNIVTLPLVLTVAFMKLRHG
ncbi:MAG: SemiSWEET transporter [Beijerinckiaceae bacterium]|jgi:MtN3 and saliva related transmembrane protein|nr:SemiSWEET transporter [Beijerinckiaceae bacterium]